MPQLPDGAVGHWHDLDTQPPGGAREISLPGEYYFTVSYPSGCHATDTLQVIPWENPNHVTPIPPSAIVCDMPATVAPILSDATIGRWEDLATQPPNGQRAFDKGGTYYHLTLYGNGCEIRDSIVVYKSTLSAVSVSSEDLCGSSPARVRLQGMQAGHAATWQNGTAGAALTVSEPDQYCATVTDTLGCTRELCAEVAQYSYLPSPWADGLDTAVCPGQPVSFAAPEGHAFECPDGTTGPHCVFALPGHYTLYYRPGNCPPRP